MKIIKNAKITQFLQGGKSNLVGTIIGFTKDVNNYYFKDKNTIKNVKDSIFIYFDHSTGTITRYLLNKGLVDKDFKIEYKDMKMATLSHIAKSKEDVINVTMKNLVAQTFTKERLEEILRLIEKSEEVISSYEAKAKYRGKSPSVRTQTQRANLNTIKHLLERIRPLQQEFMTTPESMRSDISTFLYSGKLDSPFFRVFLCTLFQTYFATYPYLYRSDADVYRWVAYLQDRNLNNVYLTDEEVRKLKFWFDEINVISDKVYIDLENIHNPVINIPKVFYCKKNINLVDTFTKNYLAYNDYEGAAPLLIFK